MASADALTLAAVCHGTILAVDPRGSRPDQIATAATELGRRSEILGSVTVEARAPWAVPANGFPRPVVTGNHP